jgi:hypothetical protein
MLYGATLNKNCLSLISSIQSPKLGKFRMSKVQRINVETVQPQVMTASLQICETVHTQVMTASLQICETYMGCTATLWTAGNSGSWTWSSDCSASPRSTASCWLRMTELHTSKEVHLSLRLGTAQWRRCICAYRNHQLSMRTVQYK